MRSSRSSSLFGQHSPSTFTNASISGKREKNPLYARRPASCPPRSSPYFFTTANTMATGRIRRCRRVDPVHGAVEPVGSSPVNIRGVNIRWVGIGGVGIGRAGAVVTHPVDTLQVDCHPIDDRAARRRGTSWRPTRLEFAAGHPQDGNHARSHRT